MNWSIKKFLAETYDFAGEPKQKPGDQVRGTEKANKTGYEPGTPYKKHPFQGRLVGGSSESVKHDDLEGQYLDEFERFMNSAQGEEIDEAPVAPATATGQPAQPNAPQSPQEKAAAAKSLAAAKTTLTPTTGIDPMKLAKGDQPTLKKAAQVMGDLAKDPKLGQQLKTIITTQQRQQPK
jgi:hypothetical protein